MVWSWQKNVAEPEERPYLFISLYIQLENGELIPTSSFRWPEGATLEEHIGVLDEQYEQNYANNEIVVSKSQMKSIATRTFKFFFSACLWMEQKILEQSDAPIERHARKRYVREHKLKESPNPVRIILLRRKQVVRPDAPISEGEKQPREWSCRWVVDGFWRQQWYPSEGKHKTKWINPFIKGPEDKPLRTRPHQIKVYAVSR
jgi:hypothetical protein